MGTKGGMADCKELEEGMNDNDRKLLAELMGVVDAVPEPRMSLSANAIGGILAYQEDIEQVLWTVRKVCEGMCLDGREGLEEDWDYLVPSKVLKAFEAWLSDRKNQDWARGGGTVESYYVYPDDPDA